MLFKNAVLVYSMKFSKNNTSNTTSFPIDIFETKNINISMIKVIFYIIVVIGIVWIVYRGIKFFTELQSKLSTLNNDNQTLKSEVEKLRSLQTPQLNPTAENKQTAGTNTGQPYTVYHNNGQRTVYVPAVSAKDGSKRVYPSYQLDYNK